MHARRPAQVLLDGPAPIPAGTDHAALEAIVEFLRKTQQRGQRSVGGMIQPHFFSGDGRRHRVAVEESGDGWELQGNIATRGAIAGLPQPELYMWKRNRATQLVGFRIDKHDRVIGESWVPAAGMQRDEFLIYVRALAAECDRLEALLTGEDVA